MYEYLEGALARRSPGRLVVDVGGIGYDLRVPLTADFPALGGRVYTHLVVREDAQELFGFPDEATRAWFRALLGVRGVGPGVALGVLSGLSVDQLHAALVAGDPRPLVSIKGIGKRTAEQILLDLRERAPRLAPAPAGVLVPAAAPEETAVDDAVRALVSIGYADKEARKSVERAAARLGSTDLEALIRAALKA